MLWSRESDPGPPEQESGYLHGIANLSSGFNRASPTRYPLDRQTNGGTPEYSEGLVIQASMPAIGNAKPAGNTPAIVKGLELSVRAFP